MTRAVLFSLVAAVAAYISPSQSLEVVKVPMD